MQNKQVLLQTLSKENVGVWKIRVDEVKKSRLLFIHVSRVFDNFRIKK